jgi:predicted outer membrane repeat protein
MKKIIAFVSFLLLCASSTSWAINLSLNQSRFLPGDSLSLTLTEDWSGKADIFVAVTLPDESLFFLTPQNFVLDFVPYAVDKLASGSSVILQLDNLPVLPIGEYVFSAAMFRSGSFFEDFEVSSISFIFAAKAEPVDIVVNDGVFPDGMIGRSYSFALVPNTGIAPFQFSLSEGALPEGLTLGENSGLFQGTPSVRGFAEFKVLVIDAMGNTGEFEGAIKVFGELRFGEHGTFKGCSGLQMAINSALDLDEIRVEVGTYSCTGLEIPSNKSFEHGLKISGGWDSSFDFQSDDPALTVFDGEEKGMILTVSASIVAIEGLSFQNGNGAIFGDGKVSIANCVFTNNHATLGGAVYNSGNITNSTFSNNSVIGTSGSGGAVYNSGNITNSTFSNNYASGYYASGGAVYGSDSITNSTFYNNSAFAARFTMGGAVFGSGNITNSTFSNNSTSRYGGAVSGSGNITNSTFSNNSATYGGAVDGGTLINCTLTNNSASESGGAFAGDGTILNSIFAQNKAADEPNDIASDGNLRIDYTLVNDISGGVELGSHFIVGDPRFVDADNGDFHLRSDSPAIDVGDDSVVEVEVDLDGNPRVIGGGVDLGAFEVQ